MTKYKNAILFIISIVLFAYAGFISIFPSIITKSFDKKQFCEKIYEASSLVTTIDSIQFEIKPNLNMIITIRNWSSKYIDNQDCFDAGLIALTTNPLSIFTKTFKIKDLYIKNAKYSNQTLPNGENKLAFLPGAFNSELFGAKKVTIISGPVRVKNYLIKDIAPRYYKEDEKTERTYGKEEVRSFLAQYNFSHVVVK